MRPSRIISGGQTGADQAGLKVAKELGIDTGGWAPKEYRTEYGFNLELRTVYKLRDCNASYATRTALNINDSDGTVIFSVDVNSPGTKLTIHTCKRLKKPYIVNPEDGNTLFTWCHVHSISILNVAGNRASKAPNIEDTVRKVLHEAFG